MCGLLVGAAILGIIIAVMEDGEFPGWGTLIICVLAASLPSYAINQFVPPSLFFLGPLVGAVTGGFAIQIVLALGLMMLASGVDSTPAP